MTESSLLLSGAVLPDRPHLGPVDVLVAGERIVALAPAGTLMAARVWHLSGHWLLPGIIDAHVHPIHAETFDSVGAASVLGGITTVLHHLYPAMNENFVQAVSRGTADATNGIADFGFHLRMTSDRLVSSRPEMQAVVADLTQALRVAARQPGVLSVKAFLSHNDPAIMISWPQLVSIAVAAAGADLPMIVHAEPGDVLLQLEALFGSPASLQGHDALRAKDLEAAAVSMAAAIARAADARLYIAHMSSGAAVDAATRAASFGTRIRGETCTHYLDLDSGSDLRSAGRVTPPLRSAESVTALRMRLGDGHSAVHVVASDHCGYAADEKPNDDFPNSGNGLPGLNVLVPLLIDAVLSGGWLAAEQLVRLACIGPAEVFGLSDKGSVEVGKHADLVVVDPEGFTQISAEPAGPASAVSPYAGRRLSGAVQHVLRRGETVVCDGTPVRLAGSAGIPVRREVPTW